MIKNLLIASTCISLILVFSCNREYFNFNIDCDECYYNIPDSADLVVNITINEENPFVPLVFYRGKVEEGIIEWIDTSWSETLYLYSPVNDYYSVEAHYKKDGKVYIAIDGTRLRTRQVSGVCERDCWIITGEVLDVRIKSSRPF